MGEAVRIIYSRNDSFFLFVILIKRYINSGYHFIRFFEGHIFWKDRIFEQDSFVLFKSNDFEF